MMIPQPSRLVQKAVSQKAPYRVTTRFSPPVHALPFFVLCTRLCNSAVQPIGNTSSWRH